MKIGINALYLIPGRVGGSEIYLRQLISALARIDRKNEYIVFTNRESRGTFDLRDNFHEHYCPVRALIRPHRILWEQLVLPYRTRQHGIDILHSPGFVAPLFCPCPSVVTILDLIYLEFPETFPFFARIWMKYLVKHSAHRAQALIALSNYSRDEILWALDLPFWKVKTVYMGGGEPVSPPPAPEERKELLNKYGIHPPFILTVAAAHPHKNVIRLLEAFYHFRNMRKEYKLVVIGVQHNRYSQSLKQAVNRLNLSEHVIFTGWIPGRIKESIFAEATMLVFPSILEGFGLPVLEGMRAGLPVACSDVSSLAEVAGDAAYLFNPYSVEDICQSMKACATNKSLRNILIDKGLSHASAFTWEKTARSTLNIYYKVMSGNHTVQNDIPVNSVRNNLKKYRIER